MRLACAPNGQAGGALYVWLHELRLICRNKVQSQVNFQSKPRFIALKLRDSLLQQLAIQIEPDRHDMAALCGAENAAGAANFQVAHRNAKACTQRAVLLDGAN